MYVNKYRINRHSLYIVSAKVCGHFVNGRTIICANLVFDNNLHSSVAFLLD